MHQTATAERTGWRMGWWGVVAAAVAVAIVLRLLADLAGIDVSVGSKGAEHPVGILDVVFGAGISAVMGAVVLHLMMRWFAAGRRWWTVGATSSLVISLVNPLQAVSWQAWAVLTLLHLTTGVIVIAGLRRQSA